MRFLADHDVYFATIQWLRAEGHDVVTAKELSMQEADDVDILAHAKTLKRLLVSRDKDFGTLVFLDAVSSPGVIYLRVAPSTVNDVHREFHRLLGEQTEVVLQQSYCVVEAHRYRIRRLPQDGETERG
jgi:predicted nuclease of predicted toxin-antitoxin system